MMDFDSVSLRVGNCSVLGSGESPIWYAAVPHESASIFDIRPISDILVLKIASANGERQILPRHTNRTFTFAIAEIEG
jgi:hypothetical protein